MYRCKKLLEAVRTLPCMVCHAQDGTVCAAHSNDSRHGRGSHLKSHDCFVAAACHRCHDQIDGRAPGLNKEQKREVWQRAWEKTILALFEAGIVKLV